METTGLRPLTPLELQQIRTRVLQKVEQPFEIYAWFRHEAVVTPSGYQSYRDFMRRPMEYNKRQWETGKETPESRETEGAHTLGHGPPDAPNDN